MRSGAGPRNDGARSLEIVELAELRGGLRVEVVNGHVGAKLRQANSNRMTQAAARSGHERDLSLQGKLFIHRSPFFTSSRAPSDWRRSGATVLARNRRPLMWAGSTPMAC